MLSFWWLAVLLALAAVALSVWMCSKRAPLKDLSKDIVLVTGGAHGLGLEMARLLVGQGATVILWDVQEAVHQVAEDLGASCHGYVVDVTDKAAVYAAAHSVTTDIGSVSILINNAGIVVGTPFLETKDELLEKVLQVNTIAHFWTTKAFLPAMMDRNSGHVVTISSVMGTLAVAGITTYCTSKYAAVGFSEALKMDLHGAGKDGITTLLVCPFVIDTGMFAGITEFVRNSLLLRTLMPPLRTEDVAIAVIRSIQRGDHYCTVPAVFAAAPALIGMMPWWLQKILLNVTNVNQAMNQFQGHTSPK